MDHRFDGITDPDLIMPAAAHEAGHVVAALVAGFPVHEVRIWRRGDLVSGVARVDPGDNLEGEDLNNALIVAVAGHEAQAFWLTEYHDYRFLGFRDRSQALHDSRGGCCTDLELFRGMRRGHRDALTEPAARARARILLAGRWRRVEHLALRLARRHHLTNPAL